MHQIGHYEVETHKGDKMTQAELHGDFALIYFGTTNSPDTVSELERLAEIVGFSGQHARKVNPCVGRSPDPVYAPQSSLPGCCMHADPPSAALCCQKLSALAALQHPPACFLLPILGQCQQ